MNDTGKKKPTDLSYSLLLLFSWYALRSTSKCRNKEGHKMVLMFFQKENKDRGDTTEECKYLIGWLKALKSTMTLVCLDENVSLWCSEMLHEFKKYTIYVLGTLNGLLKYWVYSDLLISTRDNWIDPKSGSVWHQLPPPPPPCLCLCTVSCLSSFQGKNFLITISAFNTHTFFDLLRNVCVWDCCCHWRHLSLSH